MASPSDFDANVFPPTTGPNALLGPKPSALKQGNIAKDIELKSDFYVPATYELLGFYSNFRLRGDFNTAFIPLTQAKPNPKLFAVGILPPSVSISGRLLDRSATVANVTGAPVTMSDELVVPVERVEEGRSIPTPSTASERGASLSDAFWQDYVLMCQRLQVDPTELAAVIDKESQFDPRAANNGGVTPRDTPVAQGLCQFIRRTATSSRVGMDDATWNQFCTLSAQEQLVYVEKFYQGRAAGKSRADLNLITFGGYNNPDGSIYASREAQERWIAEHPEDAGRFRNADRQDKATQQNGRAVMSDGRITSISLAAAGQLDQKPRGDIPARIRSAQEFVQRNGLSPYPGPTLPDTEGQSDWRANGSAKASDAKRELAKTSDKDQLRASLTNQFRDAQAAEITSTALQLRTLRNSPPLRFLVNPSSFKISSEKVVSDGNWTRNGPIIEHWGDNQDKIEASGKVAAFFSIDALPASEDSAGGPGLTRGARQYSASYQNFLSLYLLYRNNANLYTDTDTPQSGSSYLTRLSMVGSMYIFYDDTLYLGTFDNFNVTESDAAPYSLEYNFQFTVRATFLLDRPPVYNAAEMSPFLSRRMVLPTTSPPQENADYSPRIPVPVTEENFE